MPPPTSKTQQTGRLFTGQPSSPRKAPPDIFDQANYLSKLTLLYRVRAKIRQLSLNFPENRIDLNQFKGCRVQNQTKYMVSA